MKKQNKEALKILRRISASAFMSSEKEALMAMEEYAEYRINKIKNSCENCGDGLVITYEYKCKCGYSVINETKI